MQVEPKFYIFLVHRDVRHVMDCVQQNERKLNVTLKLVRFENLEQTVCIAIVKKDI